MNTGSPIESHTSPVPGVIPEPPVVHDEPAAPTRRDSGQSAATPAAVPPAARRTPLARLLAALRGDKYLVDAYPPVAPPEES